MAVVIPLLGGAIFDFIRINTELLFVCNVHSVFLDGMEVECLQLALHIWGFCLSAHQSSQSGLVL